MRELRRLELSALYDIAVAGSGFAGSLMAMVARRLGLSVVLLEKGRHPRVVIGESSTPLSNLLLETLANRYAMPWLAPLAKWGSWQRAHPEIPCGLKRGFTFFHHDLGREAANISKPADRQLLVAASPHDTIADTHWFRADFDSFLVERARAMGADYIDHCEVTSVLRQGGEWRLDTRVGGQDMDVRARFVVDATGPRGLMHRMLDLEESPLPEYPKTSALYSHFTGVSGFAGAQHYANGKPPYPPDAAALHHVFDGGWLWVLHFNNGWSSAGVAATHAVAERFGLAEKQAAWARLLNELPEVREQFSAAQNQTPFTYVPELSFRSSQIVGDSWAMLPSAAGFVDPLLSTGFPLTLLGILRLGDILQRDWATPQMSESLAVYARETDEELLATADLIGALYCNMADVDMFRLLSLLYFAAASYAETVRRLGKPELARSFLLQSDPIFGSALRRITARARQALSAPEKAELKQAVLELIAKFDVAGLTKEPSDHCYPVCAEDLFAGAAKVTATLGEIQDMLRRSGFYATQISDAEIKER